MMDVRFHILNEHVDKFIVTESKYSHSGKLKPLNFDINNFPKFKDKIQYLVIENEPEGINKNPNNSSSIKRMNSLLRIEQSYNFMLNALENVAKKYFQYEVILITIFVMGMLGLLFDVTLRKLIDKYIPWRGKG